MLDMDGVLDLATMKQIQDHGHSRIPIYHKTRNSIVGMILVKDLLLLVCHGRSRSFSCGNPDGVASTSPSLLGKWVWAGGARGCVGGFQRLAGQHLGDPLYCVGHSGRGVRGRRRVPVQPPLSHEFGWPFPADSKGGARLNEMRDFAIECRAVVDFGDSLGAPARTSVSRENVLGSRRLRTIAYIYSSGGCTCTHTHTHMARRTPIPSLLYCQDTYGNLSSLLHVGSLVISEEVEGLRE